MSSKIRGSTPCLKTSTGMCGAFQFQNHLDHRRSAAVPCQFIGFWSQVSNHLARQPFSSLASIPHTRPIPSKRYQPRWYMGRQPFFRHSPVLLPLALAFAAHASKCWCLAWRLD